MTLPDGLPNRPWFRHQIYAPGFYTGYGVKTIPGVREAIEQKQWKQADEQIARAGRMLQNAAKAIEEAAAALEIAIQLEISHRSTRMNTDPKSILQILIGVHRC